MNYELAKKLKDAGFRQEGINRASGFNPITFEPIVFPTLSELISACGDKFGKLHKLDIEFGWKAIGGDVPREGFMEYPYFMKGSTPEEAVAKLWLEINKKDVLINDSNQENSSTQKTN